MTKVLFEDDHILAVGRVGSAPFSLVTFSPATMRVKGLDFWARPVADKLDITTVGIVGKAANWFPTDSMKACRDAVLDFLKPFEIRLTYGSSMGGFGALKYGSLFKASHAISFAPQASISPRDVPFDHRFANYFDSTLNRSMLITGGDLAGKNFIFYDFDFELDRRNVMLIEAANKSVATFNCRGTGHETITAFAGTMIAQKLFEKCLTGDTSGLATMAANSRRAATARPRNIALKAASRHLRWTMEIFDKYCSNYSKRETAIFFHNVSNSLKSPAHLATAKDLSLKALSLCPSIPDFYLRLSQIWAGLGDNDLAVDWATTGLRVAPDSAPLYHHLADLFAKANRLEEARMSAEKAVGLAENNPNFLLRLCDICFMQGRLDDAIDVLNKAKSVAPASHAVIQHEKRLSSRMAALSIASEAAR